MRLFASLACGIAAAGVWTAVAISGDAPAKGWMTDFVKAEGEARQLGVPLVVHFYADWCGPCRQMETEVLHRSEVLAEFGTRAVGVKVNSDHRADLVTRFGITALPSDLIVGPDGKVLARSTGYQERTVYVGRIAGFSAQLAKTTRTAVAAKTAASKSAPAVAEIPVDPSRAEPVGLEGYSPVALAKDRQWTAGKPEFAASHEGIEYRMGSAAELEAFQQDPGKYAPQYLGCDPTILAKTERAVSGSIKFGAFYRGGLYLFYTEENRTHFMKEPQQFTGLDHVIHVGKIELLTLR